MSAAIAKGEPLSDKFILVFMASPHEEGRTARLLDTLLEPLEEAGAQIKVLYAYDEEITPCLACGYCKKHEACKKHDFDEIDHLLRKADAIIVASPVYNLSFPSPMKAIIDRTQRYFEARFALNIRPPIAKPKIAAFLVTLGSGELEGPSIMEKQLKMCFSVMNTELQHTVVWSHTDAGDYAFQDAAKQAEHVALAIQEELC